MFILIHIQKPASHIQNKVYSQNKDTYNFHSFTKHSCSFIMTKHAYEGPICMTVKTRKPNRKCHLNIRIYLQYLLTFN